MNDEPPLILAARQGACETLVELLECGESPNQTNKAGETALILAVQRGFEKAVDSLLLAGADPLQMGGHYTTSRYHALGWARAHLNIRKKLLASIALNTAEKLAWYWSCSGGNGYISLSDDAKIKIEDCSQPTSFESLPPLIQAIYRDDLGAFKGLLAQEADPHETLRNGLAALHQTIRLHRHAMFDALLEYPADINQRASFYHYSPLFVAVSARNDYAYRRLIDRGAQDLPTSDHHTALFAAVYHNELGQIQELIARGSDIHQYAQEKHFTLIYAAARYGHRDALKYLLSLGLNPDHPKEEISFMIPGDQLTPLTAAVKNGDVEIVELLLKAGADPNRASSGLPPLFFAVPRYYPAYCETIQRCCAIIDLLIESGADVHRKSHDGTFVLIQAIVSGHEEIALHLLKSGANGSLRDKNGKFPIDYATAQGQDRLREAL